MVVNTRFFPLNKYNLCLNKLEADLIEYYDPYNNGYNKTKGNRNATNFRGTNI